MNRLVTLFLLLTFQASVSAADSITPVPLDGSQLNTDDLAAKWKTQPIVVPPGQRTRGIPSPSGAPAITRTRGVGMSRAASVANQATLKVLQQRGVKTLVGQAAIAAQREQDQVQAPASTDSTVGTASASASVPEPAAFVHIPVQTEKQVPFKLEFALNSTELANERSWAEVAKVATVMRQLPDRLFLLEGHTCDLGSGAHNQHLSEARALRVRALLAAQGVSPDRLLAIGRGEVEPQVPNLDDATRAQNRRVVIGPIEVTLLP